MLNAGQKSEKNLIYRCANCSNFSAWMAGEVLGSCEICVESGKTQAWIPTEREFLVVAKDVRREALRKRTSADRVSDSITGFCGSMRFVYIHAVWFSAWIAYNLLAEQPFDPFPFGLLTMVVSLEAIMLATFILISQNRQSEISDLRSELDYQIDRKAEKNTAEILALLKKIYAETVGEGK